MKTFLSLDALLGDPETFSIERRTFSACTLAASIISSLILLSSVLLFLSSTAIAVNLLFTLIFIVTYVLSRREQKISGLVWFYLYTNVILLAIDWFALGGYTGMAVPVTVALAGMLPIIMKQWQFRYGLMLLLFFLMVIFFGARMSPESIPHHEPTVLHLSDRFINVVVLCIGFSFLTNIVMIAYRRQRDRLSTLNAVLDDKNKELVSAIEEIESLMARLDESNREQQLVADKLKMNNVFLDTLFEALPLPVFYKDRNLFFKRVNSQFSEVFDLSKEEIIGSRVEDIRPDVELPASIKADHKVLETRETQVYETRMRFSDGLFHQVIVSKSLHVDREGEPLGIIGSVTDITERKIREEQIQYLAHNDALTGLRNRAFFYTALNTKIARAKRRSEKLVIFFIDLDGFKKINDTFGHDAGDLTLKTVGLRLKNIIRDYDTISRLGGDEFGIILDDVLNPADLESIAKKILVVLQEAIPYGEQECFISGSIGIAGFPGNASTRESLIKAADEAMYVAKSRGRNQYFFSVEKNLS